MPMKRIFALMAATILILPSCTREMTTPVESTFTLNARIDNGDETKTLYKESGNKAILHWVKQDQIKFIVYNRNSYSANFYRFIAQNDGTEARFVLATTIDYNSWTPSGYAVYPTSLGISGTKDAYKVSLPATYTVSGTDMTKGFIPMIGAAQPGNPNDYVFKAAVGVLRITLTDLHPDARKLTLKTSSDKLSGTFSLDAENGLLMSSASGTVGHSITVNFDRQTAGSTLTVYMPVPVGSISAGAVLEVQREDGSALMATAPTVRDLAVGRGQLIKLPPIQVESWSPIGTGQFIDFDAFDDGLYVSGIIEQSTLDQHRYRMAGPYQAFLDKAGNEGKKVLFAEGPDAYLYFTLEDGYVLFNKHATGMAYKDSAEERSVSHPGTSGVNYWNSRVIKTDGTAPANIQLAPYSLSSSEWGLYTDETENPRMEIVFPGATPMLTDGYAQTATASYNGGKVYVEMADARITAVKVKAAASLAEGVVSLEAGTADLTFTEAGNQSLPLADGEYHLVYKVETDGHGYTYKDGGSFESNPADPALTDHWLTIFTDKSYSELKAGVTQSDIDAKKALAETPDLATWVAEPLLNGTYDSKEKLFRIHSYEPYSDPMLCQALLTDPYSSLNNPTGIEVSSGQTIQVCVDQIPEGQLVALDIYGDTSDGYTPNYGGYGMKSQGYTQRILLNEGLNTASITADGMLYVTNIIPQATPLQPNTTPLSKYKNVKVHILPGSGTVQGYFDPALHSDETGAALLAACTYKYFMVKGRLCSFLFHTEQLKSLPAANIRAGLGQWDSIVGWQFELMGMDQVDWFNDHMLVISSTQSGVYLNESDRRVEVSAGGLAGAVSIAPTDWGKAHEVGHANQAAICWKSNTESSNNLFSNYCRMKLGGASYYVDLFSRGSAISVLADSYAAGEPWATMGPGNYMNEDTEIHMRMFWQLWNYYHNCGYKTDFYPRLFSYLRKHPLPNRFQTRIRSGVSEAPGAAQLMFYEACCDVVQEDLTEFFETWGFFRLIDEPYSQYGTSQYTVTQAMVDASKARVAAKNLPRAKPIQYLEDRGQAGSTLYSQMGYFTQFTGAAATVSSPTAMVNGLQVTVSGCANAVAVEMREGESADGALLFFSNLYSFTLPQTLTGNSLWAVQADGTRVKVAN